MKLPIKEESRKAGIQSSTGIGLNRLAERSRKYFVLSACLLTVSLAFQNCAQFDAGSMASQPEAALENDKGSLSTVSLGSDSSPVQLSVEMTGQVPVLKVEDQSKQVLVAERADQAFADYSRIRVISVPNDEAAEKASRVFLLSNSGDSIAVVDVSLGVANVVMQIDLPESVGENELLSAKFHEEKDGTLIIGKNMISHLKSEEPVIESYVSSEAQSFRLDKARSPASQPRVAVVTRQPEVARMPSSSQASQPSPPVKREAETVNKPVCGKSEHLQGSRCVSSTRSCESSTGTYKGERKYKNGAWGACELACPMGMYQIYGSCHLIAKNNDDDDGRRYQNSSLKSDDPFGNNSKAPVNAPAASRNNNSQTSNQVSTKGPASSGTQVAPGVGVKGPKTVVVTESRSNASGRTEEVRSNANAGSRNQIVGGVDHSNDRPRANINSGAASTEDRRGNTGHVRNAPVRRAPASVNVNFNAGFANGPLGTDF